MSNLKKYFSFSNLLFFAVFVFLIYAKLPQIKENFSSQGKLIENSFELTDIKTKLPVRFPSHTRQVVIFWATWCGPCKVELSRLQKFVELKKASESQILAISVDENFSDLEGFLKTNPYNFLVVHDARTEMAKAFNVLGTPTILLVNERNEVAWRTTGISPTLEMRLLSFLN